ncbi:beta-hexosaminidase 3 [Corylus avellana]|uniref:beta-hexosaminidase 3 n=1 Tax=Corylus avellana TaxID=13451 RepID=UPI00286B53F8|nr:beta-hexosaminidase 3 [Corylus avellana]XP_059431889.1 beta-hexosaminidase 3 [Corylus avellana]
MGKMVLVFVLLSLVQVLAVDAVDRVKIWPMPKSVSHGHGSLYMNKDFELKTEGTKYNDASGILKDGFSRLLHVLQVAHVVDGNSSAADTSLLLQGLHVLVFSPDDELQYGIDESYKLSVPASGKPVFAHLEAQTVYGALHGLETFSQLCQFNFTTSVIEVPMVPWTVIDQPRFSYRGLLIDTSRHYLPLPVIKNVIDSMAFAKLNVMHWHIVDTQSFPLEIPSFPKLWDGAYSISERYTFADAAEIVSYAQRRGINVLAEIDVPGHALSWGIGYPSLWPSKECQQPLDVSNEFTFKVIDGILSDFSKVFKFRFIHLGGDEVDTSCWRVTPHVRKWLTKHRMNESQAYQYFVLRAQNIALSHGYELVNWEETFNNFGNKLSRKTVVHNWLGGGVAKLVVEAGLRCIVSNQDKWYLDHLDTTWQQFYMNEPLTNITNPEQQKLVIGGEVCMWGEHIDESDIEQTIWPRAAAAAERLWTSYNKLAKDPRQVTGRLAHFRCLLNQRGVAAAPLAGPGRVAPEEPGSCYSQ